MSTRYQEQAFDSVSCRFACLINQNNWQLYTSLNEGRVDMHRQASVYGL